MSYDEFKAEFEKNSKQMYCRHCNKTISTTKSVCFICGGRLTPASSSLNIPRCPTCQSTNVKKISFAKGYLHWRMLGVFSKTAMSQWECKSCGHKW